jgi:hypothetical protein
LLSSQIRRKKVRFKPSKYQVVGQLGTLANLNLYLSDNQLSGSIPVELGQLGALANINLQNNQLSGKEAFQSHMEEHHAGCELNAQSTQLYSR